MTTQERMDQRYVPRAWGCLFAAVVVVIGSKLAFEFACAVYELQSQAIARGWDIREVSEKHREEALDSKVKERKP